MEKREYLKNRFKRDFLQYALLQEDTLSAKEIAVKLYGTIDFVEIENEGKEKIKSLCKDHLAFDKLKVDGKLSNELSPDWGLDFKDRLLTEYKNYLDNIPIDEVVKSAIAKIERGIEIQTWHNGIVNMPKAIDVLKEKLKNSSNVLGELSVASLSAKVLENKYEKAKEITLLERIQGNNIDDIIEYRGALLEYVEASCESELNAKVAEIYAKVAEDETLDQLQSGFVSLRQYADELRSSIVECETNAEWERVYDRLIPTSFYRRNVENITAEYAFQMILLQFIARNEEWMIENEMMDNGELKVYVGTMGENISRLFNHILDDLKE